MPWGGGTWPTNIRGRAAGKSKKLPCPRVKFPKMIPCPGAKFSQTIPCPLVSSDKVLLCKEICTKSIENVEILPSKRFESHSQGANGLKRPFGVKNDKYGPCHGANFYKNDTLSRSRNPENDTLLSGTSPYGKIYEYLPRGLRGPYD